MTARFGMLAIAMTVTVIGLSPMRQARADAIDGDWCRAGGKHMTIRGSDIVTPAGSKTTGNYSRHAFSYVVPGKEPDAGKTVLMLLLNEETVHLRTGSSPEIAAGAEPEVWHRCSEVTSGLQRRKS